MQQIYNELGPEPAGYNIEILGINWNVDNPASNSVITAGVDLPWLQDTTLAGVQAAWMPAYRDVVIVNARNERVAVFNLTTNSLTAEANRNQLKSLLLATAEFEDADGDLLGDDWEDYQFGGDYSQSAGDDADLDRRTNFAEYCLGSGPAVAGSLPRTVFAIEADRGRQYLTITFRRRLGRAGGLRYLIEDSKDLDNWTQYELATTEIRRVNPYDGTGTLIVTCRAPAPISGQVRARGLRVRVLTRP